jgi:glutaredoxin-related protein
MKSCLNCGKEFNSKTKRKLYCSRSCYESAKAKRYYRRNGKKYKIQECLQCGNEYKPTRRNQKYCSVECSADSQRKYLSIPDCLEDASRKLDKKIGYVRVYCPMHPKANTWGYVYEHRLIVEGMIGRYLEKDEHIHHVNGKRWDNRPENLRLMTSSDHSKLTQSQNKNSK